MINWEVILWTCITIGVMVGIFAIILAIISAVNMKKRREQIGDIHTTLTVGTKIMFAGGICGILAVVKFLQKRRKEPD